jgi:hypothetical protein
MTSGPHRSGGPHLDTTEFVDCLDGTLHYARRSHLDACDSCRAKVDELSLLLSTARTDDVPEPSPLFWDQLSDRVRTAVAREPAARAGFWQIFAMPRGALAAAALAVVLVVTVVLWRTADRDAPQSLATTTATSNALDSAAAPDSVAAPDNAAAQDGIDEFESDEAWALVRAMAEGVGPDDLDGEGVSSNPGAADHLVLRLTEKERLELARLLEEQTKRPGKVESVS